MSSVTEKAYPLPFPSATHTPHTTDRCHRTANENLVLLTEVGSTLHGVGVGDQDDLDMQGVCIEPPEVVLGTRQFDQYEYRTKGQGIRSGPGDIDLNIYSLSKWIRLIVHGNPSHLLPLFAPDDKVYAISWPGEELRANRHLFLAREHAKRFLGYLNKQRQHMLGELSPRVNRPELVEKYGLDCYLDDTEFLTERGWLSYDQIDDSDKLATINPASGQVEFQSPTERVAKPYSGPILSSKTRYSYWAVTPNHRMRVAKMFRGSCGVNPRAYTVGHAGEWGFRRAQEITAYDWYQQVAAIPGIVEHPVSDAHLALIGAYVSEGSVGKFRKDGRASQLRFDQKEGGRLHATMAVVAQRYALRTYRYYRGVRGWITTWTLADVDVADELVKSCGHRSVNKRLPTWTLNLSGRQANVLIEALMAGDGTPHRTGGWVYGTNSERLAGDVQAVAVLAGRRANVRGPYAAAGMYQVLVHDAGATPYAAFRGRDVRSEDVTDRRIVCFTVPNETLVTRRNGHVAMHGNTKYAYHSLRIAMQGIELMRDGEITLPMADHQARYLRDVRVGKYTLNEVLDKLSGLESDLRHAADNTVRLPERVDMDYVDAWLVRVYRDWWKEKGL